LPAIKGAKLASMLDGADPAAIYRRLVSHWDDPNVVVIGAREHRTLTDESERWPRLDLAEQLMTVDAATYLPGDILVKLDRASMAVGLEARVPLLAPEIVAFSASLPVGMKIREGRGKWLLRQVLYRYVPSHLVDRPKAGFGVSIGAWLRGPLRSWASDLIAPGRLQQQALLRPEPVERAWEEHQSGRRDRSHELWDVLMLQAWLEVRGL
jgi:asparagine synthase (glutamine-hydrolysing)